MAVKMSKLLKKEELNNTKANDTWSAVSCLLKLWIQSEVGSISHELTYNHWLYWHFYFSFHIKITGLVLVADAGMLNLVHKLT